MTQYLIYRYGSNAANQPMCNKEAVAIVEAKSKAKATRRDDSGLNPEGDIVAAISDGVTVYANQSLEAVAESRASIRDWNYVLEQDAMRVW